MQRLILPFIAGFLAVPFFQQATIALLHAANISASAGFSTAPSAFVDAPAFLIDALAAGVWAIVMNWLLKVDPMRPAPWLSGFIFGGIALTAASIFVIGPLQGQWPTGNIFTRIAFGFACNAMWGWGTLVFIRAFTHASERH